MSKERWNNKIESKEIRKLESMLIEERNRTAGIQGPIQQRIEEIRNNCKHDYKLCWSGEYEDEYICQICGNETIK